MAVPEFNRFIVSTVVPPARAIRSRLSPALTTLRTSSCHSGLAPCRRCTAPVASGGRRSRLECSSAAWPTRTRATVCLSAGGMIKGPPSLSDNKARRPGSPGLPIWIGLLRHALLSGPPDSVQTMALMRRQSSDMKPGVFRRCRLYCVTARCMSQSYSAHRESLSAPSIVSCQSSCLVFVRVAVTGALCAVIVRLFCYSRRAGRLGFHSVQSFMVDISRDRNLPMRNVSDLGADTWHKRA